MSEQNLSKLRENARHTFGHWNNLISDRDDYIVALEAKLEALKEALDLIAEDALWHDGQDNPEALEDIRKTVKALGYTKEKVLAMNAN